MKVTFSLELASRVQEKRLLDLLRIPSDASVGRGQWSARWWSHGKTKRMRSTERENILQRIAVDGVNELDVTWRRGASFEKNALHLIDLSVSFSPSWTSALWAPVPTEKLEAREDERNRRSFGGGEIPDFKEFQRPQFSAIECLLEFESEENVKDMELQNRMIDWLRSALQETCESLNYFGSACLFGTYPKNRLVTALGGVAAWTDELGERFENIHPILIGPVASCEGLAAAVGDRCSLIRISEQAPIAIVSIAPGKLDEIRQDPVAKEWVVIRDLSRINAPAATLDKLYKQKMALWWEAPFVKR